MAKAREDNIPEMLKVDEEAIIEDVSPELAKSHEEVNRRNALMMQDFGNETRKMVRGLEENVKTLENMVIGQEERLNTILQLYGMLQSKVLGGGPTA